MSGKNSEYITTALETIVRIYKSIHYEELEKAFEKFTHRKLSDYQSNIGLYLQFRTNIFTIDSNGHVTPTDVKKLAQKLCELPIQPDEKYFKFSSHNNTNDSRESKSTNMRTDYTNNLNCDTAHKVKNTHQEIIILDEEKEGNLFNIDTGGNKDNLDEMVFDL
jgi:hypothetical protein